MRTIKELLELMLANQNLFSQGLCYWSSSLHYNHIITYKEEIFLAQYIKNNRPSKFSSLDALFHYNKAFYWKRRRLKPRVKWIQEHIKLNS